MYLSGSNSSPQGSLIIMYLIIHNIHNPLFFPFFFLLRYNPIVVANLCIVICRGWSFDSLHPIYLRLDNKKLTSIEVTNRF
ncbi:hypothetical protein MtrunA17_Chr7g0272491 [Medicago truncatula]|uniref:Transmembrane protein n=1 Tax=Medicago truncatula TaxID=3880 RepID=A0A396H965_MEDTR|nr:hypothetical protein MtrunA17_Chr7g0272491 [Medicago truncatula]